MVKEKMWYIKWNIKLSNIAKTGTNFKNNKYQNFSGNNFLDHEVNDTYLWNRNSFQMEEG